MNRSKLLRKQLSYKEYLIDLYPTNGAAFSLRYLSSNFVGSDVILVRRSSDDAEQGFMPHEITDGTLESFCGSGDGFVKIWYDQSGNNNDAQDSARLDPIIVLNGTVITDNGNPALLFPNPDTNENLEIPIAGQSNTTDISVGNMGTRSYVILGSSQDNGIYYGAAQDGSTSTLIERDETGNPSYRVNKMDFSGSTRDDLHDFYKDKQYISWIADIDTADFTAFNLNYLNNAVSPPIYYQERIIYFSDQSANQSVIESNINEYYNVF